MADKTNEMMALADVYAEALLSAADEKNAAEDVAVEFAEFVDFINRDADFSMFLVADTVDDDPRRESLEKLFRARMNELLLNLLQVLNNRNRLHLVRQVQRCVELRMEKRHHQQEVLIETAMPLTDELRGLLKTGIGEYIGKEPLLSEQVVPELLGGVIIHIDDVQIDASVASRIREMRHRMSERALHEIHGGGGYEG